VSAEELFAGFAHRRPACERGEVFARVGGSGPPVLLLHGYPETHLMWHGVAQLLVDGGFTVVVADLPGYGDSTSAVSYWHWGFLAQPAPLPERLILGAPDDWFEYHVRRMGIGNLPQRYPDAVVEAYRRQLLDPSAVAAMCEDYRAGATIDRDLDEADRGRQIDCPVLALWGTHGALPRFYRDVLAVWGEWASDLRGRAVEASHFLAEDEPVEVAGELSEFFTSG
jgi:haloacetate dehalogenase